MQRRSNSPAETEALRQHTIRRIRHLYWSQKMTLQQIRAHVEIQYTMTELREIVLYKNDLHLI